MSADTSILATEKKNPGMRALWRVSLWGVGAAAALSLAVFTASSEFGSQRLAVAVASLKAVTAADPTKTEREARQLAEVERERATRQLAEAERERERKQLAEAVRLLTEDRDRLATRLSTLERNLDDVTGSIARRAATRQPEAPPPVPPAPPATDAPSASIATKAEFAIDIGAGGSLDELRVLWTAAKNNYGALFAGLRPLAAVGDGKPDGLQLRLVVGPLDNAAEAARLCAALEGAGLHCRPSLFDGQRLAVQ